MKYENRVVLITGASRGIGYATAMAFAKEGAKVIANYHEVTDQKKQYEQGIGRLVGEIEAIGGECLPFEADVSDQKSVQSMFKKAIERFGKVDILVANAGICPFEEFLNIDEKLLDRVFGVNQKGAFFCAQEATRNMIDQKIPGRLVFISSVSSIFGGELQTHYCSTKGAINQLMKSVAIMAGKHGITANAVLPGTVVTDINREELNADPKLLEYFIKRTPVGRLATPEDIANAVLFFASDEASCVSGATLTVDGGMSVNLQ